ncbi:ThiF family adenylyltransferase [Lactobacillus helveticus]|uniref:ThiF family adenylyltransferase n=1 Tax=Lactobacillus helveticus TaxID=1587 RepID=UPI00191B92A1|nr:ThiF family adenylyltransferase [Lactobacillus helveticus]QYH33652.1 hypothetical protein HHX45_05615 [Lactobacillus helveticus]GFP07943.1 hypothetical protein LHEJCM1006_00890 [Lactobacillus helveticus]GFP17020.1 hypothetical protein LHEJCM20397_05680 [Lactobacillus helveticus]GIP67621.1 hypothetical protein LhelvAHU1049_18260 [Lactobacillus helveticus]
MITLQDGIALFESLEGDKLIIRNYVNGEVIKINYQESLKNLLLYLRNKRSEQDIFKEFNYMKRDNLLNVISVLKEKKVIVELTKKQSINVCVIGVGTTGSYIVHDIRGLDCVSKVIIIDPDSVELDNLYRQDYTKIDLYKKKVDVLQERGGKCQIIGLDEMCTDDKELVRICEKYKIDVLIQAGDYPSTRQLSFMTQKAANKLRIPYITNSGYISNVVSLPEFYYPNNEYNFSYKHKIYNEKKIFINVKEKVSSRIVANVGHVIARQLLDYCTNKIPFKYKERGFFDVNKLEWSTDHIE